MPACRSVFAQPAGHRVAMLRISMQGTRRVVLVMWHERQKSRRSITASHRAQVVEGVEDDALPGILGGAKLEEVGAGDEAERPPCRQKERARFCAG